MAKVHLATVRRATSTSKIHGVDIEVADGE